MKTPKLKKVIVKAPNGPATVLETEISLEFLQGIIGGDVERRRFLETGCFVWCNEDGMLARLEPAYLGPCMVLGTVVLTGGDTPNGDIRGLTSKQVKTLLAIINDEIDTYM